MAKRTTTILGSKIRRGKKMPVGGGWRLLSPNRSAFKAALVKAFNVGDKRVAVFKIV